MFDFITFIISNSGTYFFSRIIIVIGNKIASVPNDEDHNFGHGKAEYIFSMFIAISMILVSSKLLFDSFQTLILGSQLQFSWLLVVVCIITIITKLSLFLYTQKTTKKYSNILLESNMQDHRNDCIVTSFTLLSIILTLFDIHWFDSVVGIGISLWIAYTGITIFMESYNVLMDISVDEKTKNIIMDIIHTYSEIKKVDNISSTPIGSQYIIFITIGLDGNMPTFESHKLADSLEKDVSKLNNIYKTIVHVNPI